MGSIYSSSCYQTRTLPFTGILFRNTTCFHYITFHRTVSLEIWPQDSSLYPTIRIRTNVRLSVLIKWGNDRLFVAAHTFALYSTHSDWSYMNHATLRWHSSNHNLKVKMLCWLKSISSETDNLFIALSGKQIRCEWTHLAPLIFIKGTPS